MVRPATLRREVSNPKIQIPITRHQTSSKSQIQALPSGLPNLDFATLEIAWDLELGAWDFRDLPIAAWLNILCPGSVELQKHLRAKIAKF